MIYKVDIKIDDKKQQWSVSPEKNSIDSFLKEFSDLISNSNINRRVFWSIIKNEGHNSKYEMDMLFFVGDVMTPKFIKNHVSNMIVGFFNDIKKNLPKEYSFGCWCTGMKVVSFHFSDIQDFDKKVNFASFPDKIKQIIHHDYGNGRGRIAFSVSGSLEPCLEVELLRNSNLSRLDVFNILLPSIRQIVQTRLLENKS